MILDFPTMIARQQFVERVRAERQQLSSLLRLPRNFPQVVINEEALDNSDAEFLTREGRQANGRTVDDTEFRPTL